MTVLITGASGGLGRAMAVECASRGYDVVLTDLREAALAEIAAGITRRFGVKAYTKACDLTKPQDVQALFEYIEVQDISLGMLLGIAGVDFEGGFMARECEKLLSIVQLNIEATLRVTHAALRHRKANEKFHIVIVSSLASLYPIPLKATYAASKRFLLDFSIALRQELRQENVNVMALCPGGLPTTREAMAGIAAQGVWGNATTNSLAEVSRKTIDRVLAGRAKYIPGFVNTVLSALGRLIPRTLIARLLHCRWIDAQKQWLKVKTQ